MNNDLISREALKQAIEKYRPKSAVKSLFLDGEHCMFMNCITEIDNAPTVEVGYLTNCANCEKVEKIRAKRPQGEWIPVSEGLPEIRDWYLGVFKEPETGFIGIPYICDYVGEITKGTTKEGWILRGLTDTDTANEYYKSLECVAWQPLPEPYQKDNKA